MLRAKDVSRSFIMKMEVCGYCVLVRGLEEGRKGERGQGALLL